jgi:WD40 repeat protein/formylglycine-generating enzyme required for sulfatase activity
MAPFDPYHIWLGISETARPVSKYRLLSIDEFESDRDVISTAAERQTVFLRTLQAGEHSILVAELLNEVSQARVTLLNADQKAVYDEELREQQTPEPEPEPTPIPVVQTPSPTPVVVRGTVTQEFPVSVVQTVKRPRRRRQKEIWKRPAVIGVSLVGVIAVLALMMFSGDAEPVASNVPPVVTSPFMPSPVPVPEPQTDPVPHPVTPPTLPPQREAEPEPKTGSESEPQPTVSTLAGHTNTVYCVSFSRDGKWVASAGLASVGGKNNITIWDTWTGERFQTIEGVPDRIFSIAFSTDGKTIASGNWDRTIKFWDIDTGAPLGNLGGHANYVRTVAFSPGGKVIASGSNDQTIKLWDAGTGTELRTLTGHSHDVNSVAFSPDGNIIASGSRDQTIKLWDGKTGLELWTVKVARSSILSVAFSPNGKMIASGCSDNTIKLWDAGTGTELSTLTGHSDDVNSVAFSPNGKTIASGSDDNTIKLWDVETRTELNSLVGHSHRVFSVAFAPDGKMIASGSADKTIKLWDLGSAPVQAIANTLPASLQQGLVAYYPFNGNAKDESGNGQQVIVFGTTPWIDRFGNPGSAYKFDGADDYIRYEGGIIRSQPFTWAVWFKSVNPRATDMQYLITQAEDPGGNGLSPDLRITDTLSFRVYDDATGGHIMFASKNVPLAANTWYHAVITSTAGGDRKLYVNGQLDGVATGKPFGQFCNNTYFGVRGGLNLDEGVFNGSIDDIRIYNRALSEAEVKALYDYESKPPASSTPTAPAIESITNTIGMKLNLIPSGTFMMGSPEGEPDRSDNEHQHPVTISKAFYMQTTEVTQGQWKALMGTEPWKGGRNVEEGTDYPAVYVSYDDAVEFCRKLSKQEAVEYRLPTEAEWEYACRAGAKTRWSFGDDEKALGDYGWYDRNASGYAHQVGEKKPNAFGLYDMHGNVWEWCSDYYSKDYYKGSPKQEPQGPAAGSSYVFRGGSWFDLTLRTRSTFRNNNTREFSNVDLGFRLVRELD